MKNHLYSLINTVSAQLEAWSAAAAVFLEAVL